jgi:hypothetical protein
MKIVHALGAIGATCLGLAISRTPGGHVYFEDCRVDLSSVASVFWTLMNVGTLLTPFAASYALYLCLVASRIREAHECAASERTNCASLHAWLLPGAIGFLTLPLFMSSTAHIAPILLLLYLINGSLLFVPAMRARSAKTDCLYGAKIKLLTRVLVGFGLSMALLALIAIATAIFE